MPIRSRKKDSLRKGKTNLTSLIQSDLEDMITSDGDTITFEWTERTGATWNETYEVWEGGTTTTMTQDVRGLGRVVDYAEDEMEYEFGRIAVGDCLIRFPISFDIEQFEDKTDLRFIYKGQRWKPDSPLGVGETFSDVPFSKLLKGVKSLD
ncbi:hypothetical protein [Priestia megaterium]|uniref:hypothetical protein n=1 Tax=Priestia megaterium TaxID=1404 RepID=UPI00211CDB24|nr:hypothetical protein [Priestia megaterium]